VTVGQYTTKLRVCDYTPSHNDYITGALLVFDVTNRESFEKVRYWFNEIQKHCTRDKHCAVILIGTKIDLASRRVVDKLDAIQLSEELGIPYVETSSKTGEGVNEAFMILTKMILDKHKEEPSAMQHSTETKKTGFFFPITCVVAVSIALLSLFWYKFNV